MATMMFYSAICFLFASSVVQGQCLENLSLVQNQEAFNVCTANECFIFIDEPPYVFVDEDEFSRRPELQIPFRCGDFTTKPGLKGAFFDIVSKMSVRNSYCVWGGSKCTFDKMVSFINSTTTFDQYKWIAGGILFLVPERIQSNLIGSASLLEDELRVVGPPSENSSPKEAWATIWKPFTMSAWGFLLLCVVGHLLARAWLVIYFSRDGEGTKWRRFRERFMSLGASIVTEETSEEEECWERMNNLWLVIAKIFLGITIILWEVAIAVLVFEARILYPTNTLSVPNFAMWADTTQEYYFKQMFDIKPNSDRKWARNSTQLAVFDELIQQNNRSTTLEYGVFTRYIFKTEPEKCRYLREYDDVPRKLRQGRLVRGKEPPKVSGVWIYGVNVSPGARVSINRQIVEQKSEEIHDAITNYAGEKLLDQCTATTRRIDWVLLGLLLAATVGGLFGIYFVAMIYISFRPPARREEPKLPVFVDTMDTEDDSVVKIGRTQSNASGKVHRRSSKIYRL